MNKLTTKRILESVGIKVVPYLVIGKNPVTVNYSEVAKKLGRKLFVKPCSQGSSVGTSKVNCANEFQPALDLAFKYDEIVLVEKAINGHELETALLGNSPNIEISGVGEVIAGDEFYSYDAKYALNSNSKIIIPANINEKIVLEIQDIARKVFEALGCSGMARVDFFLDGKEIYVNEVNTLPGFTDISMYPKLWLDAGLSSSDLIEKLINLALERG